MPTATPTAVELNLDLEATITAVLIDVLVRDRSCNSVDLDELISELHKADPRTRQLASQELETTLNKMEADNQVMFLEGKISPIWLDSDAP